MKPGETLFFPSGITFHGGNPCKNEPGHFVHVYADGVDTALARCAWAVRQTGVIEKTRAGMVKTLPHPVAVTMGNPRDRWLTLAGRNSNPFYFLADANWVLRGRDDLETLVDYLPRIADYSDDGKTLDGMAYGHRLAYPDPQWDLLLEMARNGEIVGNRRVALAMLHPRDLAGKGNSIPCNTQLMFRAVNGRLDMCVTNRSNDLFWGAFGANSVCFSYMQEIVAELAHLSVGHYTLFTKDLHVYEHHWPLLEKSEDWCKYAAAREPGPPDAFVEYYETPFEPFHTAARLWGVKKENGWKAVRQELNNNTWQMTQFRQNHPNTHRALLHYTENQIKKENKQ